MVFGKLYEEKKCLHRVAKIKRACPNKCELVKENYIFDVPLNLFLPAEFMTSNVLLHLDLKAEINN